MKIEEARQRYNVLIRDYHTKEVELSKKKQMLEEKMKETPNGAEIYKNEVAILSLQYKAVKEKGKEYQDYMTKLLEQWNAEMDLAASCQQSEAMEEQMVDMQKIMLVARRIMHGDKVPAKDEQKLMEYDEKLYALAKNAGALAKYKNRKEYESLWDEEEEKEIKDAEEIANSTEAFADGPRVVAVETTLEQIECQ